MQPLEMPKTVEERNIIVSFRTNSNE